MASQVEERKRMKVKECDSIKDINTHTHTRTCYNPEYDRNTAIYTIICKQIHWHNCVQMWLEILCHFGKYTNKQKKKKPARNNNNNWFRFNVHKIICCGDTRVYTLKTDVLSYETIWLKILFIFSFFFSLWIIYKKPFQIHAKQFQQMLNGFRMHLTGLYSKDS